MGKPTSMKSMINDSFLKKTSMINDRDNHKVKFCSDREAENGAERLVKILSAPECRNFFIKVMYRLPYIERERILEMATKPNIKSPKKYFTHSAKIAMEQVRS